MSTISAGTSSGTALVSTGDTSGNLELQSSGVTKLTVGSGGVTLASALPATSGGTGATTYTTGDVIYASATNTLSKLGIGSPNQVLTVSGGVPAWVTPATPASGLTLLQTVGVYGSTGSVTSFSSSYYGYLITVQDLQNYGGGYPQLFGNIGNGGGNIPMNYASYWNTGNGSNQTYGNGNITLGTSINNLSGNGGAYTIYLYGVNSVNTTYLNSTGVNGYGNTSVSTLIMLAGAQYYSASSYSVTYFRLSLSSGSTFGCTMRLYGIAQ